MKLMIPAITAFFVSTASFAGTTHQEMTQANEAIASRFHQLVMDDPRFQPGDCENIRIDVTRERAILSGTLDTDKQVQAAEELARKAGNRKVNNLLRSYEEINNSGG